MGEWKEYKLCDFAELIKDTYNPNGSDDFNYIGLEHIEQESLRLNSIGKSSDVTSNKFKFEINDILFGKLRPYFRKVVKPKFSGICSTDIWVFRAKKGFSQDYLYYFLANWDFVNTANNAEGGTRMPRADWSFLKDTSWEIPPIEEQRIIASILSSLDAKIDLLHRQNKTLEGISETLFRQWFVKQAEDSWEEKPLGEFIETTLGGEWGKENAEGEFQLQVQCIRGTDIADLETGIPERTPIRFIKQKKYDSIEIMEGDLIMEISGGTDEQSTGRTAYINNEVKALFKYPLVFSNFCRLIRPKSKEYSFFLYSYIHYLYKQDEFFNLENGSSGIKNLDYKSLLFSMEYKLPSEEDVIKYHYDVKQYFYKINKNKSQILTLAQLRDNLLPKLMSGEVKVK